MTNRLAQGLARGGEVVVAPVTLEPEHVPAVGAQIVDIEGQHVWLGRRGDAAPVIPDHRALGARRSVEEPVGVGAVELEGRSEETGGLSR